MRATFRRSVLLGFLGIALGALAACGGSSDEATPTPVATEPPTSTTEPPTSTTVPTPIPTTTPRPTSTRVPTAVPTATQTPPANPPVGELFIYVFAEKPVVQRVVLYDVGTGDPWASFRIRAGRGSVDVLIAGAELLVRVGSTIDRTTLDGRPLTRLFEGRDGYTVRELSLAPGGQILALSLLFRGAEPGLLLLLDSATGDPLIALEGGGGAPDALTSQPGSHQWSVDGTLLAVTDAYSSHGQLPKSIVSLDGSVRTPPWGFLNLSPEFRRGVVPSPAVDAPCLAAWSGLMIRDIDTEAALASTTVGAARLLGGITWSPDSSSVLYTDSPRPPPGGTCADIGRGDETHYLLEVATGEVMPATDIEMLRLEWDLTPRAQIVNGAPGAVDSVILDGVEIARGENPRIIGFVELD